MLVLLLQPKSRVLHNENRCRYIDQFSVYTSNRHDLLELDNTKFNTNKCRCCYRKACCTTNPQQIELYRSAVNRYQIRCSYFNTCVTYVIIYHVISYLIASCCQHTVCVQSCDNPVYKRIFGVFRAQAKCLVAANVVLFPLNEI